MPEGEACEIASIELPMARGPRDSSVAFNRSLREMTAEIHSGSQSCSRR